MLTSFPCNAKTEYYNKMPTEMSWQPVQFYFNIFWVTLRGLIKLHIFQTMAEEQEREATPTFPLAREAICVEKRDGPVTLRLLDGALWQAFRHEGTEMIITKAGR